MLARDSIQYLRRDYCIIHSAAAGVAADVVAAAGVAADIIEIIIHYQQQRHLYIFRQESRHQGNQLVVGRTRHDHGGMEKGTILSIVKGG